MFKISNIKIPAKFETAPILEYAAKSVGVSKTREKRAADAIAWRKTVGKTLKHLTANQHPGVSQPHYPFTAHPPSQPIRENLPAES